MKEKFGYKVERWESSHGQYLHAEVSIWKLRHYSSGDGYGTDKFAAFTWQTDRESQREHGRGNVRLWYALSVKTSHDLYRVEDVNEWASFMRKLIRRVRDESINGATPEMIVAALEGMKIRQMVYDRRNGRDLFLDEVENPSFPSFRLREPGREDWTLENIVAADENEAQRKAIAFMAERAQRSNSKMEQFTRWVADGMPLERVYESGPNIQPAVERINEGLTYRDYYGRIVDGFGIPVEEETVEDETLEEAVNAIDFSSLWNEEN